MNLSADDIVNIAVLLLISMQAAGAFFLLRGELIAEALSCATITQDASYNRVVVLDEAIAGKLRRRNEFLKVLWVAATGLGTCFALVAGGGDYGFLTVVSLICVFISITLGYGTPILNVQFEAMGHYNDESAFKEKAFGTFMIVFGLISQGVVTSPKMMMAISKVVSVIS